MIAETCLCIFLGQFSYHFNREYDWNEQHNSIGVEYNRMFLIHFDNSYYDESTAIGYHPSFIWNRIEFGAKIGVVKGYKDNIKWWTAGDYAPFILFDAIVPITDRIYFDFNLLPSSDGFMSVGFKVKLK